MSALEELLKEFEEEKPIEKVETTPPSPKPQPQPTPKSETEVPKTQEVGKEVLPISEEETAPAKTVWLIFGEKGVGKTTTAFSFPGHILVLSFDRKSSIIKYTRYNGDSRIHVFDVVKIMDYSTPDKMLESAEKTFEATLKLLDAYEKIYGKPDWVVIDGSQIMQQICEWTMRYRNKIPPFAGISNLNLWKERRAYMRDIHNKALNVARCGVIYTTYTEVSETIVSGEVVSKKEVPAWIDILIYETDFVLKADRDESSGNFLVKVVTSKDDSLMPSGKTYIVTNKHFWEVVGKNPCRG